MKLRYTSAVLLSLLLMAACEKQKTDNTVTVKEDISTSISTTMTKASEEARKEIISGNMSLGGKNGLAKAEITPKGDLLIDNKPVTITAEQRALLVKHRALLVTLAISGMEIGMQGAELATEAVGEAIKSVFNGDTDQVEKKVEAKAEKIEESARVLCDQLPLLLESQKNLADKLPEFKPYATMTFDDVNDCHTDTVRKR